jgi:hypothetical protein
MNDENLILVFVHGWSVTNLDTYGELPLRLQNETNGTNETVVKNVYLGQYISFHDEVQLQDISRAFETAVKEQLSAEIANGDRFVCITHSTGGPVVRDWYDSYYNPEPAGRPKFKGGVCPMSHLIMLAPANFGSALAQLGKSKISRLKSWLSGVEPGQGVLNWLELGSDKAWELNARWIKNEGGEISANGIFPFAIIGQSIDRKLYDNLNTYTGELGSDGVVRSAAANLNASYVSVKQGAITYSGDNYVAEVPTVEYYTAPATAFLIVPKKSHSDTTMGIMASPTGNPTGDNPQSKQLVDAILDCIKVKSKTDYDALSKTFEERTAAVQKDERVEKVDGTIFIHDRYFYHDRFSMVIFRIHDSENYPVINYDLTFTAGDDNDANHLPEGFFVDRQCNRLSPQTVTYYMNYDVMHGCDAIKYKGKVLRPKLNGIKKLGITVEPHRDKGFIKYLPFNIQADAEFFDQVIKPNSTTLIDICLQRVVDKEVSRLNLYTGPVPFNHDFHKIEPSKNVVI